MVATGLQAVAKRDTQWHTNMPPGDRTRHAACAPANVLRTACTTCLCKQARTGSAWRTSARAVTLAMMVRCGASRVQLLCACSVSVRCPQLARCTCLRVRAMFFVPLYCVHHALCMCAVRVCALAQAWRVCLRCRVCAPLWWYCRCSSCGQPRHVFSPPHPCVCVFPHARRHEQAPLQRLR